MAAPFIQVAGGHPILACNPAFLSSDPRQKSQNPRALGKPTARRPQHRHPWIKAEHLIKGLALGERCQERFRNTPASNPSRGSPPEHRALDPFRTYSEPAAEFTQFVGPLSPLASLGSFFQARPLSAAHTFGTRGVDMSDARSGLRVLSGPPIPVPGQFVYAAFLRLTAPSPL